MGAALEAGLRRGPGDCAQECRQQVQQCSSSCQGNSESLKKCTDAALSCASKCVQCALDCQAQQLHCSESCYNSDNDCVKACADKTVSCLSACSGSGSGSGTLSLGWVPLTALLALTAWNMWATVCLCIAFAVEIWDYFFQSVETAPNKLGLHAHVFLRGTVT